MAEKELQREQQQPVVGASESSTPREQRAGGQVEGGRTPGATPASGSSSSSKKKKTGKERRREKRLRNEPQSVSGKVSTDSIFIQFSASINYSFLLFLLLVNHYPNSSLTHLSFLSYF